MQEQAGPGMVSGVNTRPQTTQFTTTNTTTTSPASTTTTAAAASSGTIPAKKSPADVAKMANDPGIQGVGKSIANIQNPKIRADWIKQYTKTITGKDPKPGTPPLQIPTAQQLVAGSQ
jgi:hypothetical protein